MEFIYFESLNVEIVTYLKCWIKHENLTIPSLRTIIIVTFPIIKYLLFMKGKKNNWLFLSCKTFRTKYFTLLDVTLKSWYMYYQKKNNVFPTLLIIFNLMLKVFEINPLQYVSQKNLSFLNDPAKILRNKYRWLIITYSNWKWLVMKT